MLYKKLLLFSVLAILTCLILLPTIRYKNYQANTLSLNHNLFKAVLENPKKLSTKEDNSKYFTFKVVTASKEYLKGAHLKGEVLSKETGKENPPNQSRAILRLTFNQIILKDNSTREFKGWITGIDNHGEIIVNTSGNIIKKEPDLLNLPKEKQTKPTFITLYSNKNFIINQDMVFEFDDGHRQ